MKKWVKEEDKERGGEKRGMKEKMKKWVKWDKQEERIKRKWKQNEEVSKMRR